MSLLDPFRFVFVPPTEPEGVWGTALSAGPAMDPSLSVPLIAQEGRPAMTAKAPARPTIVCLCGSTRFTEAFRAANLRETLAGHIVLSIGCEWHGDDALGLTEQDKARLDTLHLRKIDLTDEVLFLNQGGYLGHSTARELAYALAHGKHVRYLETPEMPEACPECGANGDDLFDFPLRLVAVFVHPRQEGDTSAKACWLCENCIDELEPLDEMYL